MKKIEIKIECTIQDDGSSEVYLKMDKNITVMEAMQAIHQAKNSTDKIVTLVSGQELNSEKEAENWLNKTSMENLRKRYETLIKG